VIAPLAAGFVGHDMGDVRVELWWVSVSSRNGYSRCIRSAPTLQRRRFFGYTM
jgi:hypothetical protein